MRITGKMVLILAAMALIIVAIPIVMAQLDSYERGEFPAVSSDVAPADGQGSDNGSVIATAFNSTATGPNLYVVTNGWGIGQYDANTMVGNSSGVERHIYNSASAMRAALLASDGIVYLTGASTSIAQIDTLAYNLYGGTASSVPAGTINVKSSDVWANKASTNCPTLVSSDGNYIYFVNGSKLYKYDWAKGTNTSVWLGTNINTMALTPDGSLIYVNLPDSSSIVVVKTSSMGPQKRITYPYNVYITGMAMNTEGTRLYASGGYWGSLKVPQVKVIDTTTDSIVDTIYLGDKYGIATDLVVDPNAGIDRLYVAWSSGSSSLGGNISCINTVDDSVIRNIAIGNNLQRIVALKGTRYLYVSSNDYNLYRVDLSVYPPAIFTANAYSYKITDLAVG